MIFDKTGTLTKANPTVVDVVSFNGQDSDELLRIAACLEEHFPHSMAKAVVDVQQRRILNMKRFIQKLNILLHTVFHL